MAALSELQIWHIKELARNVRSGIGSHAFSEGLARIQQDIENDFFGPSRNEALQLCRKIDNWIPQYIEDTQGMKESIANELDRLATLVSGSK